jgi:hypothetical protein
MISFQVFRPESNSRRGRVSHSIFGRYGGGDIADGLGHEDWAGEVGPSSNGALI